jgi:hypothetical protein
VGERRLERVVILPLREVRDGILPDLLGQVFLAVRVETLPGPDRTVVHQADREELATALRDLGLAGLADLGLHPLAAHAVR